MTLRSDVELLMVWNAVTPIKIHSPLLGARQYNGAPESPEAKAFWPLVVVKHMVVFAPNKFFMDVQPNRFILTETSYSPPWV